jgi:hypothetical protein
MAMATEGICVALLHLESAYFYGHRRYLRSIVAPGERVLLRTLILFDMAKAAVILI